ncbi:hypothetical protein ABZ777_15610 [Micromonospora parva]|uniref:hypothetical protein n=1 Tax=Micromonospora parva TaxID=1464048 RepID=UPI0033F68273
MAYSRLAAVPHDDPAAIEAARQAAGASVQPNRGGIPGGLGVGQPQEIRLTGEFKVRGNDLILMLPERAQLTSGGMVSLIGK